MAAESPVESIFFEALAKASAEERAVYVEEACAGDQDLRRRVDRLLQAHPKADSFLQSDIPGPAVTEDEPSFCEVLGTVIGPYKLLQQIGEGGMGTVFMAEQTEPVQRKVALKLIKSGMDRQQVIARFEAERQALALMDHPNIARVLDAGATASGRPYFVMELVKGVPITKYCDEHHLTPRQRLELFVPVCQAVQHAHQKGIVHRDLKPSNVMVCLYDGKPVPKVIDFGIAKAAGPRLTEKTLFTELGQVVGTLEYMSPEQAELNQLDIDTRSDIYSLGVLLYELLTGTTPLERKRFQAVAFLEVLRLIREEESPKPSTRLSTAEGLPSIAANRGLAPKKLSGLMRGELDWIVMKTLEKDRNRRYETANGLAMDVQRYLADEAVQACPPSTAYRLKKFLRRNKRPVLAASLVLLALVGGIIGTTLGLLQAQASEEQAQEEALKAGQERDRANDARDEERKAKVAESVQRQRADAAKEAESAQRKQAEAARDRASDTLDAMTSSVVGDALGQQKFITPEQKEFLNTALGYYRELLKEKAHDPAMRKRLAAAAFRVGLIESRLGRTEQGAVMFRESRDLYGQLARQFPEVRHQLARSHNSLGLILAELRKEGLAEGEYRAAKNIFEKLTMEFPDVRVYRQDLAITQGNLGNVLSRMGKWEQAEEELRAARDLRKQLATTFPGVPSYRDELAVSHFNLGVLLLRMEKPKQTELEYVAANNILKKLARESPSVRKYQYDLALSYNNLANVLMTLDKPSQAETAYRAGLDIKKKLVAEFPSVPLYRYRLDIGHCNLGRLLRKLDKLGLAAQEDRAAIDVGKQLVAEFPGEPNYRSELARNHSELGLVLAGLMKGDEAEAEFRSAIDIRKKLTAEFPDLPEYRRDLAASHFDLGDHLDNLAKPGQAQTEYRSAIDIRKKLMTEFPDVPKYRRDLATSHFTLGNHLDNLAKPGQAQTEYRSAIDIQKKLMTEFPNVPEYRHDCAASRYYLGNLLAKRGKPEQAQTEYRAAIDTEKKATAECPDPPRYALALAGSSCNLGHLLRDGGQPNDALDRFDQAIGRLAILLQKEPKLTLARQFLRNSHYGRARTLDQLKRHEEAIKDWTRMIDLSPANEKADYDSALMASRAHAGQFEAALKDAERLAKSASKSVVYDCACVCALAYAKSKDDKHAVRAVQLLREAIAKGFRDADHLKKDADLDSLRVREDFRKLVVEVERLPTENGR